MREDDDLPELGSNSRTLGARAGVDVRVLADGSIIAGRHGISVSPSPPENLPHRRRSPEFGGTGKEPVFEIDTRDLPRGLISEPV